MLIFPSVRYLPRKDQRTCLFVSRMMHLALSSVFSVITVTFGLWRGDVENIILLERHHDRMSRNNGITWDVL